MFVRRFEYLLCCRKGRFVYRTRWGGGVGGTAALRPCVAVGAEVQLFTGSYLEKMPSSYLLLLENLYFTRMNISGSKTNGK